MEGKYEIDEKLIHITIYLVQQLLRLHADCSAGLQVYTGTLYIGYLP